MTSEFFKARNTYRHEAEGVFYVEFAGRAPAAFEHHSETLGVAFGWRIGPDGEPLGAYYNPDFEGWDEVPTQGKRQ